MVMTLCQFGPKMDSYFVTDNISMYLTALMS